MPSIEPQWLSSSAAILAAIAFTFVLAGLIKGVIGLGLPTIAMGLLGIFMPPLQAATLLIVPSLVTNVQQMLNGGALRSLLRRLWSMQLAVVIGTLWAPVSMATLDARIASAGLGAALMVYALLGLASVRFSVTGNAERWVSPAVGLITGAITAATGVFVVPAAPYLQGLGLSKDELVQALGLSFTVSTVALSLRLAFDGSLMFNATTLGWGLIMPLAAALLGMAIGQKLRGKLSEIAFKRVFFAGLLLVALHLIVKGLL
ncbi:MAG: sulfite exporter TauE/SafE family protein [Burkholderiales bacterium]